MPETADAWQKATQVASNPLTSYRMVRRFSHEFDAFGAHVNQYLEGSKLLLSQKKSFTKVKILFNISTMT